MHWLLHTAFNWRGYTKYWSALNIQVDSNYKWLKKSEGFLAVLKSHIDKSMFKKLVNDTWKFVSCQVKTAVWETESRYTLWNTCYTLESTQAADYNVPCSDLRAAQSAIEVVVVTCGGIWIDLLWFYCVIILLLVLGAKTCDSTWILY